MEDRAGVWSFVKDGKSFQSLGVSCVSPVDNAGSSKDSYNVLAGYSGDKTKWAEATRRRLKEWGFNTAGAWCDESLYAQPMLHTRVIGFGGYGGVTDRRLIDVFSGEYAAAIEKTAGEEIDPHKNDPWLIGYFNNNELPFYGEHGWPTARDRSLLDRYLELPATSAGKKRLVEFFRAIYPDAVTASRDWEEPASGWDRLADANRLVAKTSGAQKTRNLWAGVVAERYFSLCEQAVRRHDPNHLILGCRHAGKPLRSVAAAEGSHVDVISINHYRVGGVPDLPMLHDLHVLTGRPVLITEYSWRATENSSGDRNQAGAEVTVGTQAERADRFEKYTTAVLAAPYIVGAHWFQYFDEPAEGRSFDHEDSDYGLVDIHDQPYEPLVAAAKRVSATADRREAQPFSFDEAAWGELTEIRLAPGVLAHPLEVPLTAASCSFVKSDAQNGSHGEWKVAGDTGMVLAYHSGAGWGLHGDVALPDACDAAGARSVTLDFTAPPGLRVVLYVTETGDAEPGLQVYQGQQGADGESYELPEVVATGKPQRATFAFDQAALRSYWGNQRGNHVVDLNGLRCISIFVPPNQGSGEITIEHLTFTP